MAITRAQIVRQLYKNGSKGPVMQAGVMNYRPSEMVTVPKIAKSSPTTPTAKLAYITPEEQDILIDLNLYGSLKGKPNRGPGGIPSLEGDFGGPGGFGGFEGGADFGGARDSQGNTGDFSGTKDTGTGDYVESNPDVSINRQRELRAQELNKAKEAEERRKAAIERELKKAEEEKALKNAQDAQAKKVMDRRKRMGLKLMKEKIPGTQEYLDAEKDDTAAKLDLFINDPKTKDQLGFGLTKILEPLFDKGAVKSRSFFTNDVLNMDPKRFERNFGLTPEEFMKSPLTKQNQIYSEYMSDRLSNTTDAFGNSMGGSDRQPAAPMIPMSTSPISSATDLEPEEELSELQRLIAERGTPYRFMANGGIMSDDVIGGMADGNFDEMGRQMYGLGKLVKKATRAVKKIVKSPVGVAALGAYGFGLGPFRDIGYGSGFLSNLFKGTGKTSFIDKLGGKATLGILGASALAGLTTPDEDEDQLTEEELRGPGLDLAAIRANPYATKGQAYAFYADGGDVEKEPVAKKVMPLLDMDGMEKDYRETGGFVPIGRMEKADDVPARLSKNEFVFTADAVRNAGDGDIDKGAEVMYNMMKNLENGGDVSEESQGLEGARNMFQTSQRLEEVL